MYFPWTRSIFPISMSCYIKQPVHIFMISRQVVGAEKHLPLPPLHPIGCRGLPGLEGNCPHDMCPPQRSHVTKTALKSLPGPQNSSE